MCIYRIEFAGNEITITSHRERCRERIYVIPGNRVFYTPIIEGSK